MYEILFYEDDDTPITIYRFSNSKAGERALTELQIAHPTEEFEGREVYIDNYVGPIWQFMYNRTRDELIGCIPSYDPIQVGYRGEFKQDRHGNKIVWGFLVAYSREDAIRKIRKEFSA